MPDDKIKRLVRVCDGELVRVNDEVDLAHSPATVVGWDGDSDHVYVWTMRHHIGQMDKVQTTTASNCLLEWKEFTQAEIDSINDTLDNPEPDPEAWVICPTCDGNGKHSRHMGDFTMSEFNEVFDGPDDQQDYLDGAYDKVCDTCRGLGRIQYKDMYKHEQQLERELIARTGRNSYGEPC